MAATTTLLVTGATGLIGGDVLAKLLAADRSLRAFVLVRDPALWHRHARRSGIDTSRIEPVRGDVREPLLGLDRWSRRRVSARLDAVLHAAANTEFSQSLESARAVNVAGTRHALDVALEAGRPVRFVHLSTAFVAGRRTGVIREKDTGSRLGWVNAYEQSKAEAEALVALHAADPVIFRPSTVAYDAAAGSVRQLNAVHRALRLCWHGLVPMLPTAPGATVDLVTADYVGDAIAALALRPELSGRTVHLCAGAGAAPLSELLDVCWRSWSRDHVWRRRTVERPALAPLETYRLFERGVYETGDERLRRVLASVSHFAPQLALPKTFDTTTADALLGRSAPAVRGFWPHMLDGLATVSLGTPRTPRAA